MHKLCPVIWGGGLRYMNGMLQSILKFNKKFNISVVGHESVLDFLNIDRKNISLIEPAVDTRHPLKRLLYSYRLNSDLDKKFQNDTLYWLPINYGLPFKMKNIKTILTIHDLNWFQCPEISPFIRRQFKKKGVTQAIKNSDVIISISNFTKQQVYLYFNKLIRNKPFYVLYEGCTIIDERSFLRHPVLEKREKYMLGVKVAGKNKNIEFLLQCFNRFKGTYSYEGKLYLVGWIGKERKERLLQSIKGTTIENDVEFLDSLKMRSCLFSTKIVICSYSPVIMRVLACQQSKPPIMVLKSVQVMRRQLKKSQRILPF